VVALLVRLKLTLLKNSLKRSTWRTVGLIIAMVYALGVVVLVLAGLVGLRFTSLALTADVTVIAYAALTAGWLLMSMLVFGVDETIDPAKFALLPVRSRQLMPGLLVAGLISAPGVATVVVGAGLVITWARTVPLTVAALIAVPLGIVTCFLLSRAATVAFASFLASRRFRDLAFVGLALFGAAMAIAGNLISSIVRTDIGELRRSVDELATLAAWSPFGWAWALPADVSRGAWPLAAIHLILAVALVVTLWMAWGYFLGIRLVSPIDGGGGSTKVRDSRAVERLYPATPAGGIAARTLRYWRRDPRYLAGIAGFLIAPIVLIVAQVVNAEGKAAVAVFAPSLLGLLVGLSLAQDLSYDGTALWLHISAGISGADDRAGRVMSTVTIYLPLTVILLAVAMITTGQWHLLVPAVGLTFALMLTGLGVGSVVGTLWQWPAPPPGANPFTRGNAGGLPSLLSFTVTMFGTLILALPTIALVIWSFFTPWIGYLTLPIGLICGFIVLRTGIAQGGRILDRRWPEAMLAVSEKAA
jgi:ABC-2 type transport system permease protein